VTTVLQVLVSPRRHSVSRLVAQQVTKRIVCYHPGGSVVVRDLAADPPPHPEAELYEAILTGASDDDPRLAMSERMIAELESADFVVIGTPMNNFTVPSTLKAWIDHVVRIRRTFCSSLQGKIGLLRDRPMIVVAAHGGYCGEAPAGQPDFLVPYLRTIFGTIGIREIHFLRLEGLSRGDAAVERALALAKAWVEEHAAVLKAQP
jgi:FMN-dependent NADH-azoreductase